MPIGHFAPLTDLDNDEVLKATEAAIKALEVDNCAVNMDFIAVDKDISMHFKVKEIFTIHQVRCSI